MDVLKECQKIGQIRETLESLPETLDETYNRILEAIHKVNVDDAYKVLQWLAFSARPVKLEEVTDALAVDLDKSEFKPDEWLTGAQGILKICSSLVTVSKTTISDRPYKTEECYVLTLAHFSVKEYLLSDNIRISRPKVSRFSICKEDADILIAQTCLVYLLQFNNLQYTNWTRADKDYPLARYSAQHWVKHAQSWGRPAAVKALEGLVLKLLQPAEAHYVNWNRFYQADLPHKDELDRKVGTLATPLYYMSFVGLTEIARTLLSQGADVNARGGHYNNPLQAAACQGHDVVVQLLLSNGADTQAWGGRHGTALHAAAYNGSEAVARLLIEHGADVSAEGSGPVKAVPLEAAKFQWLALMNSISLDGGHHPSVLEVAAYGGHEKIVQLLLENGAKMTAGEGLFGNVLVAAAFTGREDIVRQLLDAGADVNATGGHIGSALQAASKHGDKTIVQLLLERGAKW
jgi:ankyrin repeat protein